MSVTKWWKGISLIEVVIAIYVFGIGILVILKMLVSNIGWLYDIKTKDMAVSLAKEGIDIVFHQRDSNIEKGMPRYCAGVIFSWGSWECERDFLNWWTSWTYIVSRPVTGLYAFSPSVGTADRQLRYHSGVIYSLSGMDYNGVRYTHEITWGITSEFSRRLEFSPVSVYPSATWYILQVQSIVQYDRWSYTKQIILESVVGDIR